MFSCFNWCLCVKQGLIVSSAIIVYFGLLSTFALVYSWFLFLRFLVGFGIGGSTQAYAPVFIHMFKRPDRTCN